MELNEHQSLTMHGCFLFRACFRRLPKILCFNTMRYLFNMVTMMKEKVNSHFSFPLRLDMSQYMEENLIQSDKVPSKYLYIAEPHLNIPSDHALPLHTFSTLPPATSSPVPRIASLTLPSITFPSFYHFSTLPPITSPSSLPPCAISQSPSSLPFPPPTMSPSSHRANIQLDKIPRKVLYICSILFLI